MTSGPLALVTDLLVVVHMGLGQVLNILRIVQLGQVFFQKLSLVDAGGSDVVVIEFDRLGWRLLLATDGRRPPDRV